MTLSFFFRLLKCCWTLIQLMFVSHSISNLDDSTNRFNALSMNGVCQPQYETKVCCCRIVFSNSTVRWNFCHLVICVMVSMCLLFFFKSLTTKVKLNIPDNWYNTLILCLIYKNSLMLHSIFTLWLWPSRSEKAVYRLKGTIPMYMNKTPCDIYTK